jgi:hypothetical protein
MRALQNGTYARNRAPEAMIHGGFGNLQRPRDGAPRDIGQLRRQHRPFLVGAVAARHIEALTQLNLCDDGAVTVDYGRIDVLEWRRRAFLHDPLMCLQDEMTRAKQKTQNGAGVRTFELWSMFPLAPAAVKNRPDVLKQIFGLDSINSSGQPGSDERGILLVQQLE